jgi:hypothetical protein
LDFAFSVPWQESCGRPNEVMDTKALWALVDRLCISAPHMYAGPIWTSPKSPFLPYILHSTSGRGDFYDHRNLRMVEQLEGRAISIYHMVGVQVGAGSFAGMRMLHQISQSHAAKIAIWPFDEVDGTKTAIVEIYPSSFYRKAGSRRPSKEELTRCDFEQIDRTLEYYGCKRSTDTVCRSVDQADALISAAALRSTAGSGAFKFPDGHTFELREGWIFGVPTRF